ncbi:unnamed protein product, partial [Phytomonas sp. Hart1]
MVKPSLRTMVGFLGALPREGWALNSLTSEARLGVYAESFARFVERIAGDRARYPFDRARCAQQALRAFRRRLSLPGARRQLLAFLSTPDWTATLRETITSRPPSASSSGPPYYIPTVVIHGAEDPLSPPANGERVSAAIPGSRLILVEGMGHPLLPALRKRYVGWIAQNIRAGEAAAAQRGELSSYGKVNPSQTASPSSDLPANTGGSADSKANELPTGANSKL